MNILILTNHLAEFAGSEIQALEVYEYFKKKSYHVKIFANYIDNPIKAYFNDKDIITTIEDVNIANFDLIWSQHCVFSRLFKKEINRPINIKIVSVHLSPYILFELSSVEYMKHLDVLFIANSEETKDKLIELGVNTEKLLISHNAAPEKFSQNKKHTSLKQILIVSNHPPNEIIELIPKLSEKYNVDLIGKDNHKLITPKILAQYDLIVSIGKTVQYALLSSIPIYCYDHFGGPGYIHERNYEKAKYYNFSGRGFAKKNCNDILFEIEYYFDDAVLFSQTFKSKNDYILEKFMAKVIDKSKYHVVTEQEKLDIVKFSLYEKMIADFYCGIQYEIQTRIYNEYQYQEKLQTELKKKYQYQEKLQTEMDEHYKHQKKFQLKFEMKKKYLNNKISLYKKQRNIVLCVCLFLMLFLLSLMIL